MLSGLGLVEGATDLLRRGSQQRTLLVSAAAAKERLYLWMSDQNAFGRRQSVRCA